MSEIETNRSCETCKYEHGSNLEQPCLYCFTDLQGWEPKPQSRPAATPGPQKQDDRIEESQIAKDYTDKSILSAHKDAAGKLVKAHWSYMQKVLTIGADKSRTFTFEEVMKIREWDYTSAALHFYGHGFEDGISKTAEMALNWIKEA